MDRFGLVWLVLYGMVGLAWYVWFGMFGLVWQVWFGFEDDLKGPLVPLKVAKPSLELHLGTIPGRLGYWVGLGPIVIIRLS